MYTWDEVETLVCGKPEVDVDLLEVYHEREERGQATSIIAQQTVLFCLLLGCGLSFNLRQRYRSLECRVNRWRVCKRRCVSSPKQYRLECTHVGRGFLPPPMKISFTPKQALRGMEGTF